MVSQNATLAEILQVEYLVPIGMTADGLAERMRIPASVVRRLLNNELSLSAQLANGLLEVFHTTPEHWIDLQLSTSFENEDTLPAALQRRLSSVAAQRVISATNCPSND